MKNIAATVLILLAFISTQGQPIIIQKKDSSKIEADLKVFSKSNLRTNVGSFYLKDISKLYLGGHDVQLESYAKNYGIQTYVKDLSGLRPQPLSEGKLKKEVLRMPVTDDYYQNRLLQFKNARETGKIFEALGLVAVTIAINQKNPDKVKGLAYAGGAVMAMGFIIDWSAGKYLKK